VIGEQLRSAVEELRQRLRPRVGLEVVLLLDRDPRRLSPLLREFFAQAGQLLFALEQFVAGGEPLFTGSDFVLRQGLR